MDWRSIVHRARQLARREHAQDLLEYAMLAALISIAVLVAVSALGGVIKSKFWDVIPNVV